MRDQMRDKLNTEITRKQFLQFFGAALLTVFGFHNLLSLLSGNGQTGHSLIPNSTAGDDHDGFGARRFGV
jgi:hypothetical protein